MQKAAKKKLKAIWQEGKIGQVVILTASGIKKLGKSSALAKYRAKSVFMIIDKDGEIECYGHYTLMDQSGRTVKVRWSWSAARPSDNAIGFLSEIGDWAEFVKSQLEAKLQ